jgi:hypothetical protein
MLKFSACLCSPLMALALFWALSGSLSREFFPEGGYAALAFEAVSADESAATDPSADGSTGAGLESALERALGRPVLSEFSQWVFLNDFGGLEQVSLEDYEKRLESFDPRRDAYALKLWNFFNRDGKCWFFIPLDRAIFGPFPVLNPERVLQQRIGLALDGRSFSLFLKREGRPPLFRFLPFALAWPLVLLLAGPLKRRWRAPGDLGLPLLCLLSPLLFVVSLWGAPGCALAALFLYLAVLLAPPLREFWVRLTRLGARRVAGWGQGPYRVNITLSLVLTPLAGLILWAGRVPPLAGMAALGGLCALCFLALGFQVRRSPAGSPGDSCRFVPLPILAPRPGRPLVPVPFALASCLAFLLNPPAALWPAVWDLAGVREPWPLLVSEGDYEDHVLFQTGFALRSLRSSSAFAASSYFHYTVGEDGLVAGVLSDPPEPEPGSAGGADIPPFPLADLSDFLAGWAVPVVLPWNSGGWAALIPPLLALGLCVVPGPGGKKPAVYDDKRIAA